MDQDNISCSGCGHGEHRRECPVLDCFCAERPDAAPPKVPWKDVLKQDEIIEIDENGKVHLASPPSDGAPVAWRIRSLEPGAVGTWFYRDERPHQLTMEDSRGEVQPLYVHPEDAPRPDKESECTTVPDGSRSGQVEDAPGGPSLNRLPGDEK